jgi:hypothetical protein
MRRSSAVVSAGILVVLGAEGAVGQRQATAPGEQFLLARGRAGYLELGQSGDDVYGRFGRENVRLVDTFAEGTFTPALEVRLDDRAARPALVARLEGEPCGRITVWGISVYDGRFRTSDGLGVGSTLGDIRKRFKPEVSEAEFGPAAYVEGLGLTLGSMPQASRTTLQRCCRYGWCPNRSWSASAAAPTSDRCQTSEASMPRHSALEATAAEAGLT